MDDHKILEVTIIYSVCGLIFAADICGR